MIKGNDKVIITDSLDTITRGKVVGVKPEPDKSTTYFIATLGSNFNPVCRGSKVIRINSKDIDKTISIKIHEI